MLSLLHNEVCSHCCMMRYKFLLFLNNKLPQGCIPGARLQGDANLPIGMLHPERNGIGMQIHLYFLGVQLGCHQKLETKCNWDARIVATTATFA